ncbi:hypothetical protein HII31_09911 [Pseudocercospora fuligena]|uniref:Uncharacterized protein n=1 Tax=Pseudocercospora fuligena TaxID=685502 RepID=A0A8H6RCY1_9PEZI|nr:hypothetical protein HII31_09911 [Pseudocercospora fuligena]
MVYHNWLWERYAVGQCLLVLQEFSKETNIPGLRRELRKAASLDWTNDIWVDAKKTRANEAMFPFIATCLFVSSTHSTLEQEAGGICPVALLMPINWEYDSSTMYNDDGLSIIDISEPGKPRYGFMFPGENVLLDSGGYLAKYGISGANTELEKGYGNVALSAIRSTWPGRNFKSKLHRIRPEVGDPNPDLSKLSLKDRSLSKLLDVAFDSDDLDWTKEAELIAEFQPALMDRFHSNVSLANSKMGPDLLGRAFKDQTRVDLSFFQMSLAEIQRVLDIAWADSDNKGRSLIMPTLKTPSKAELKNIVEIFKPIVLNLGEAPGISLRKLFSIVSGSSINHFACSALYKRSLELIGQRGHLLPNIPPTQFPNNVDGGFPVTQMIYLRHCSPQGSRETPRSADGSIDWAKLIPANDFWNLEDYIHDTRPIVLPLRDSLISPERAQNLLMVLAWMSTQRLHRNAREILAAEMQGLAKQFAELDLDGVLPTQPIPAEMYEEYRRFNWLDHEHTPKALKLEKGQWTFLATAEADPEREYGRPAIIRRLHYAFVTLAENNEIQSFNATGFFENTIINDSARLHDALEHWRDNAEGLFEALQNMTEDLELEICSSEEVESAFQYLDAYNDKIDAYEEANQQRLEEERQWRRDFRANGQLPIRL